MNNAWSRALVWLCGVKVSVVGRPPMHSSGLWVSNHVSWIDIFILAGVRSVFFVAKSEIRRWPVVGWLVAKVGTVFLHRGQRHAVREVSEEMQRRFARGEVIGLFAEGTTSTGFDVLPFHASLFDPAIRAQVAIQPVALRFMYRGERSDFAAFVGEETLVANLWTLLRASGVQVEVVFLPEISPGQCQEWGRNKVARYTEELIRDAVRVSDGTEEPAASQTRISRSA